MKLYDQLQQYMATHRHNQAVEIYEDIKAKCLAAASQGKSSLEFTFEESEVDFINPVLARFKGGGVAVETLSMLRFKACWDEPL